MCGIAGFISNKALPTTVAEDLSRALLYYSKRRGAQSAGIYTEGRCAKQACDPHEFVDSPAFYAAFPSGGVRYALLHTRQPTCGGVGNEQAQPFVLNDTATVHNGMLFNIETLVNKWGIGKNSGVDSELYASFIEKYGIRKLPDFLESTSGPSAVVAWHKGRLFAIRSDNPLWLAEIEDGTNKLRVFASEPAILQNAIRHVWLLEQIPTTSLPEGYLYEIPASGKLRRIGRKVAADWGYDEFYVKYPSRRSLHGFKNMSRKEKRRQRRLKRHYFP